MIMDINLDTGIIASPEDTLALQELVRSLGKPFVIEVGTWTGHTARAMVDAGACVVYCVDTWEGTDDVDDACRMAANLPPKTVFAEFQRLTLSRPDAHKFVPMIRTSLSAAQFFFGSVDMIFLDADHREDAVKQDIKLWTSHVRSGGILCGHDLDQHAGVRRAVETTGSFQRAGASIWWRRVER